MALAVATLLLATGLGHATTYTFLSNPDFETGSGTAAPPWTFWGGTGGATNNPSVSSSNSSSRVWCNFGNPTYKNVAAQNAFSTNFWVVPGDTYHVHAQYYVPSSEVQPGVTPRAGFDLRLSPSGELYVLNPTYPDQNVAPVPSPNITNLDQWVTFDFDWVCPGDPSSTPPYHINYMFFGLYGGNGTELSTVNAPNPGGYFDNLQFSSSDYRNDVHGFVKDGNGNPIAGATVIAREGFSSTQWATAQTLADGSYSFTNLAGYGFLLTADATAPFYTSRGSQYISVSATSATEPDIIMDQAVMHRISGSLSGLPSGASAVITAVGQNSGISVTTTNAPDSTYNVAVGDGDTYTVTVASFPRIAPAQTVVVSGADVPNVNFALVDSTLVWYKFDGNTLDSSTNNNNSTLLGGAVIVPHGRVGGSCLSTTSANGGVTITNALGSNLVAYTMSAWMRVTGSADWQTLWANPGWVSNDVNNVLRQYTNLRELMASVNGNTPADQYEANHWNNWAQGDWHFITIVYDSTAMTNRFYFDGVFDKGNAYSVAVPVNFRAGSTIGCFTTAGNRPFTGEIDDFRVCAVAARDADVAALYASYPPPVTHTITVTADAGSSISPSNTVTVLDAYNQSFAIYPRYGYVITNVTVDGVSQSLPLTSYTFVDVTNNHSISVSSALLPTFTILATADGGSTIVPTNAVTVVESYTQSFNFGPRFGYKVSSVAVDGVAQSLPLTSYTFLNVSNNHTIAVSSVLLPTYTLSGQVFDSNGNPISGATVYINTAPNASVGAVYTVTTAANGSYSQSGIPQGTYYVAAGGVSGTWNSADQQVSLVANTSGVNFTLLSNTRNIPAQSSLWFSAVTESLPASGATGNWTSYLPAGQTFTTLGTPTVTTVGNQRWESNQVSTATGYHVSGPDASSTPVNGATIVVAVKPMRTGSPNNWQSVVDIYRDNLVLGIQNGSGYVNVRRNNVMNYSPTAIPDGQMTILSMVVQPDGTYTVYTNGIAFWNNTNTSTFSAFTPAQFGSEDYRKYVDIGRNQYDGWSTFNGDIGDVFVYTTALSDADRTTLEADLADKFNITLGAPTPVLSAGGFSIVNGVPTFTFATTAGYKYRVVYKNALSDPSWQVVAPGYVTSSGGNMTVTDNAAGGQPQRFYRIEAAAP